MEHRYIEESDIADRYLLGQLPPEEEARFEEHFVECQECLERLETTGKFRRALKAAVVEDAARASAYAQAGLLAWLLRRSRRQKLAMLLATLLLPAALAAAFFVPRVRRAQEELEQAKRAAADSQRRYEEQQRAADRLEQEPREANVNSTEPERRPETPQQREPGSRPGVEREVARSSPTQVPSPVFALSIVRSADPGASEPANRISLPRGARSFVLSLDLEDGAGVRSYRATIRKQDGRVVWSGSNLKPHSTDTLRIRLDAKLFEAGVYRLTLEGLAREGNYLPEGKYDFRVSETE